MAGGASLILLLAAWEAASLAIGKEIILPSPARVLAVAISLYPTPPFLSDLWATFLRGLAAFGLSAGLGIAAGLASGRRPIFGAMLAPILTPIMTSVLTSRRKP